MARYLLIMMFLPEMTMFSLKFDINITANGCWIGYIDENGVWHNAMRSPCESFNEALFLRDQFQEAHENITRVLAA